MSLPNGISLHVVEREPERLPFVGLLLRSWMDCGFEAAACRTALEVLLRDPRSGATEELLRPRAVDDGGLVATEALLFPRRRWSLRFQGLGPHGLDAGAATQVGFDESAAPEVSSLLRGLAGGEIAREILDERARWLAPAARAALAGGGQAQAPAFPRVTRPGIYRREHGCAVIRSRTTTLMLDPVSHWMPHPPRTRVAVEGELDGVFVTHGHADHWNIASILAQVVGPTVPVVVPPVPRASLLAPNDMYATLRLFCQNALAPPWGSVLRFGDIDVDVLPFYGEQPVREGAGPAPGLRNWGSCYRFNTPDFSAIALIDSGFDPDGSMADVVRASADERGPADVILSSLPRFGSPFFFGLPHYYLTLPFARLRALYDQHRRGQLPSVTPGPDGVVEICAAGRARHYLPYGNGFAAAGVPIDDVGMHIGEPPEAAIVDHLRDRFRADGPSGPATVPLAWNPGDAVVFDGGRAQRVAYADLSAGS